MIKNGLYQFETIRQSSLASEVEDSLKKHFEEQHFSPNCSNYYIDQIKSAFDNAASKQMPNNNGKTITTVSEMVNDLMMRTGLKQYVDQVEAAYSKQHITTKKAETQNAETYAAVPEIQQAVKTYIENNGAFQFAPVLNVLKKIKDELIANQHNPHVTKLSPELMSKELKDDKQLLDMISQEFAHRITFEMSDVVHDIAGHDMSNSTIEDDGLSDATWKQAN